MASGLARVLSQTRITPVICRRKWAFVATVATVGTLATFATFALPSVPLLGSGLALAAEGQNGRRIVLHGNARIELRALRKAGKLAVSGRSVDDAGKPAPGRVALTLAREAAQGSLVTLSAAVVEPCAGRVGAEPFGHAADGRVAADRPLVDDTGAVSMETTDDGRFCVRLLVPVDRYVVQAHVAGTNLLDAADASLTVDLTRTPVSLRFDPERTAIWIDEGPQTIEVAATSDDDDARTAAAGLALQLSSESGDVLGGAVTDDVGHARFVVPAAKLGPPGKGELRVAFAGNATAGASTRTLQIERRTHVDLVAPAASSDRLPPGSPEDGIELGVNAVLRCAKDGCSGSPSGTVEARLGGEGTGIPSQTVGAAPVERGRAHVVATFPMPASPSVRLHLHYASDTPWFLPGDELALEQPLQPSSPWRKLPLALAALVLVILVVLARVPLRKRRPAERTSDLPDGPGVAVVREASASEGWSGMVVDAHDGIPLGGVRVAIERPGMLGTEAVAQAVSDDHGRFSLGAALARPGDELVAEGRLHAMLRRPLPKPGVLSVAVLQRKRALLSDLVEWVKKRGEPFTFKNEPTPGELSSFAALFRKDVSEWADAVERAAYGGAPVDESVHEEVSRLAPVEPQAPQSDPRPAGQKDLHRRVYRRKPR
jgi:hypothetical protein